PYLDFEQKAFLQLPQPTRQRLLQPLLAYLDSGAKTQQVYSFVRTRPYIYAIKGSNQQFAPVNAAPTWQDIDYKGNKIKDGVQLWQVGVHRIKKLLYGRLKLTNPGPRYIHFPHGLPDEYYRQLTAEKLITHSGGKEEFKKERPNEALDCFDDQTEVLTEFGWKYFAQLSGHEKLATVNLTDDQIEYQAPLALIAKPYEGQMISLQGRRIDI